LSAIRWIESIAVQLPLRAGLGGVFCLAAWKKLGDIQSFAEAIKGFKVVSIETHEYLIIIGAFTMPWIEMIAGVLLVLGLWTRAASLTIGLMLIVFIAALIHVIFDDSISANCSCFGDMKLVCGSDVGWCQVIRDLVMLLPAIYLIWRGGGILSLDSLFKPNSDANSETQGSKAGSTLDDDGIRG
jgi:uncharacterized membrane protein YphA (DoxX/SURF4 family)